MMRSRSEKGKYSVEHKQLNDKQWLVEQYSALKKTTQQIAKEVGCVSSTVYFALIRLDIPKRTRKEARKGIKFSNDHLENITKANRAMARSGSSHHNWQGGKTNEYDRKMAAIKRHPKYKAWRKVIVSIGYCEACGSSERLEAHHVLPKSKFPHLIHDLDNGKCLCHSCHATLHRKDGELLGSLEQAISSQAEAGMPQKVQRLEAEARPAGNASTSSVRESDDIVRSLQGCKADLG